MYFFVINRSKSEVTMLSFTSFTLYENILTKDTSFFYIFIIKIDFQKFSNCVTPLDCEQFVFEVKP